jgi:hypothetical protein
MMVRGRRRRAGCQSKLPLAALPLTVNIRVEVRSLASHVSFASNPFRLHGYNACFLRSNCPWLASILMVVRYGRHSFFSLLILRTPGSRAIRCLVIDQLPDPATGVSMPCSLCARRFL